MTVAHGTRNAAGNAIAREITADVGRRLGMEAVASYVELCAPAFADVVAETSDPTVVVPLLLSTGHHVRVDLPAALAHAAGPVTLGRPLGPDRLLAQAQATRLREAGARPGQPVVLVAAGSQDPRAAADLSLAGDLLAEAWGGDVRVATLSGHGQRPVELVDATTAVSPYLLAPGHFADRTRTESLTAGAAVCADVIGAHPLVADLAARRANELRGPGSASEDVPLRTPALGCSPPLLAYQGAPEAPRC